MADFLEAFPADYQANNSADEALAFASGVVLRYLAPAEPAQTTTPKP